MRLTAALGVCFVLTAVLTAPAAAQRGGDAYSLRRYLGSDAYRAESFTRPNTPVSQQATINEAARQSLPSTPAAPVEPTYTSKTNSTLNYYGAAAARQTLNQMPRRPRFVPQGGQPVGVGAKPYSNASIGSDPTVSPYLNLFREEDEDSLPNYYTFVRPFQNQIETNRAQQRQLQGLERQVQRTAYQVPAGNGAAAPPTGFRARFGDTGQYYGGWR